MDKQNQLNQEINLPKPLRPLELHKNLNKYYQSHIYEINNPRNSILNVKADGTNIPMDKVQICNLSKWQQPPKNKIVAIDPELGRLTFNRFSINEEDESNFPEKVKVKYCYGLSSNLGGGTYARSPNTLEKYFTSKNKIINTNKSDIGNDDINFQKYTMVLIITKDPDSTISHENIESNNNNVFSSLRSALDFWKANNQISPNTIFSYL